MKILITGKSGQVGYELERSLQGVGEIIALDRKGMDLANLDQVRTVIRNIKPDLIVNAAAYTAVDKAENDEKMAMQINGTAPGVIAEEAAKIGASIIHYSTDYVFDGTKPTPYVETDKPHPVNVYGKTKLAGEQAIQAANVPYIILRTSWVYGVRGNNFLKTIVRLSKERDELRIVADQFGAPTWCRTIADTTANVILKTICKNKTPDFGELAGIYHLTSQGDATWFEFAKEILNEMVERRPNIVPISSLEYPVPAKRPPNSRLDCQLMQDTFSRLPHWKVALRLCQEK